MRYTDFSIRLDPGRGGGFTARVVRSPAGQARGEVVLELDEEALPRLADRFERLTRSDHGCDSEALAADDAAVRALGGRLWKALFSRPVSERLYSSLEKLGRREGLRIRLHMELDSPEASRLFSLPWEALIRPDRPGQPLSLDRQTVLVRSVDLPLGCDPLRLDGPLRILVVTASPKDQPSLDLEGEVEALRSAFRWRRRASITVRPGNDLLGLRETLLEGQFHVLHFMGHGDTDRETGEGCLLFEDRDGFSLPVRGRDLASLLAVGLPSLRLVFLNACRTARTTDSSPFSAVGTALLNAKIPAVLAMQFPLSDLSALSFSKTMYRRLAAGDPLEAAVVEGRHAIRDVSPRSGEWVTPVLFLRAEDGTLVERNRSRRLPWLALGAALALVGGLFLGLPDGGGGGEGGIHRSLDRPAVVLPLAPPKANPRQEAAEKAPAPHQSSTTPSARTQAGILPLPEAPVKLVLAPIILANGEGVSIEPWQARISVQFQDPEDFPALGDHEAVTVTLTTNQGDSMLLAALGAPTPLVFELAGSTRRVQVEHIDWQAKTVRLLLPQASP